jgi:hypothetical protein
VLTPAGRAIREQLMQRLLEPPEAILQLSSEAKSQVRDVLLALVRELAGLPRGALNPYSADPSPRCRQDTEAPPARAADAYYRPARGVTTPCLGEV